MSLYITSLNSGSNGNCYYIGNDDEAILIDAGLSCRETEKRMKRLDLPVRRLKAIFISHEHTDHISGLQSIVNKFRLPVYITKATKESAGIRFQQNDYLEFTSYKPVAVGNLSITAFPKYHDAKDPYSFIISYKNLTVGVFTDIGVACKNLIIHFKKCHAAFLEANYDEEMLDKGSYPYFLKNRIRGGMGHLSNRQALDLFISHKPPFMSHLLLSHLSNNNNCPDLVYQLFNKNADGVNVIVASRHNETPVYHIQHGTANHVAHQVKATQQLSIPFV